MVAIPYPAGAGARHGLDPRGLEITIASSVSAKLTQANTLNLSTTQASAIGTDLSALAFKGGGGLVYFYATRFVAGTGIGGEYSAVNSAIDETMPARYRGRTDIWINGSYWLGSVIGTLAAFLLLNSLPTDTGWRLGFLVGPVPAIVILFIARAAPPEEVFAAVTAEAGRLLGADITGVGRHNPDGTETLLGMWAGTGAPPVAVGTRLTPGARDVSSLVFQTSRPARIDSYADAAGPIADLAREVGIRAVVGAPIGVAGRLWGAMFVGSLREPLPAGTEARLAGFTELAATAIANAQARAELAASRARMVAVGDAARRRIQRNLHDGAQQRLVTLSLGLQEAQAAVPPGADELAQRLEGAVTEVADVLEELKEIARGLHPAVLTDSGLRSALRALVRRSGVPVSLDVRVKGRLPEPVEVAAYYAVAEALTNIANYADASAAEVEATTGEGVLQVWVRDGGRGGADFGRGSGLAGLKDRIEALGGRISLDRPPGGGTTLQIALPLSGLSRSAWES
jgi:signal transduction histidine kinase